MQRRCIYICIDWECWSLTKRRFDTPFTLFASISSAPFEMKYATVLLAAAATVSAHSTWQELWVGTEDKAGTCVRTVKDNSPVTSLTSPDMFCGRGPAASSGVCEVAGTLPSFPPSCFPAFPPSFYNENVPSKRAMILTCYVTHSRRFPDCGNARTTQLALLLTTRHRRQPLRPRPNLHGQSSRRKDRHVRILLQGCRGRIHGYNSLVGHRDPQCKLRKARLHRAQEHCEWRLSGQG